MRAALAALLVLSGAGCLVAGVWVAFGLGAGLVALGVALLALGLLGIDVDQPASDQRAPDERGAT